MTSPQNKNLRVERRNHTWREKQKANQTAMLYRDGLYSKGNRIPLNGVKYKNNIIRFVFYICLENRLNGYKTGVGQEDQLGFLQKSGQQKDGSVGYGSGSVEQWMDLRDLKGKIDKTWCQNVEVGRRRGNIQNGS